MTLLSKNFTLEELYKSNTADVRGIDNTPDMAIKANLLKLVTTVLQPLRDAYGKPINVTSCYRCSKLNEAVKGSKTSLHMKGLAADIKAPDGDNATLFNLAKKLILEGKITTHQLIWEYGNKKQPNWVHIGAYQGTKRNQILYLYSK